MARRKYNWAELREEYINGDFESVKGFFMGKYGVFNSNMSKRSTGRCKERDSVLEQATDMAIKKSTQKLAKKFEMSFDDLLEMKYYGLQLAKKAMNQIGKKKGDISPKEIETLIKIIKTELGEPTNVTQASVENTHEIVNEDPCRSLLDKLREEEDGEKSCN